LNSSYQQNVKIHTSKTIKNYELPRLMNQAQPLKDLLKIEAGTDQWWPDSLNIIWWWWWWWYL